LFELIVNAQNKNNARQDQTGPGRVGNLEEIKISFITLAEREQA
jgi:hypothetical protein